MGVNGNRPEQIASDLLRGIQIGAFCFIAD
jgi:hypothetical protein